VSEPRLVFGERVPGRRYVVRRAAYAVIRGPEGRIATVKTRRGHFLPGGGIEAGETDESGLEREIREECARALAIARRIGEAVQWFGASRGWFEGHHVFFAGSFASEPSGPAEHELVWLAPARARALLFHASHVWAIGTDDG
jgi:8-oxo-dGTP diphosphatase